MSYSRMLKELFPEITLHAEDLLLLEAFQINYLQDRVAEKEFSILLREYPVVNRFLVSKCPAIASFLTRILDEHKPEPEQKIMDQCQEALWEIADLIVYNKHPELYDQKTQIQWDISELTAITSLEGKSVADVGAGSGRIAFMVAPFVRTVFAIEPITSFRSFMKDKALKQEVENLFVMDGTLDYIPLPDNALDVLFTSNAIGWNINEELKEIERVVKPEGYAIHLLHADSAHEDPHYKILTSAPWDYQYKRALTDNTMKIRYYKKVF